MNLVELLRTKSSEYELLVEWHAERATLDDEHFVTCSRWPWAGSCSGGRRIAGEWGEETDTY